MDIKISDNLFIGPAELNRFKKSLGEKGWKMFAKHLVSQFGIAKNSGNTMFLPIEKSGTEEVITIKPGVAFDSNMNIIILENQLDISLPSAQLSSDSKYWVILRHNTHHYEEGTVNVSFDGALTGVGTNFLSVLRGQPDFPTKIRFDSVINTGDYEVLSVASDTSAIISGSFNTEYSLRYSVIGTFTPGFIPSDENSQIYEYDSYEIEVINSDTEPTLEEGNEFLICSVNYVNGAMQLNDYRIYYMMNNPYVQTTEAMRELATDSLVSLVKSSIVSMNNKGIMMQLQLQHGFKVTSFETNVLTAGYAIDITSGESNFITSEDTIPTSLFKGWYLLNCDTMSYSVVSDSSNKRLLIKELNPDSVSGNNIVLVPPFKEIEYQIILSNNVPTPTIPYSFRCSIENVDNNFIIPILYPDAADGFDDNVVIAMRYRLIGESTDKYPFKSLAVAKYEDYDGESKTVSDSTITVPISEIQPESENRNYS